MKTMFADVDKYINSLTPDTQILLEQIRAVIKAKAPDAAESISYSMPAYKLRGKPLVYFAAFKNHIGLYATPSGHAAFFDELSKYPQGKGSVQFAFKKPIPFQLIERIVEFRIKENIEK